MLYPQRLADEAPTALNSVLDRVAVSPAALGIAALPVRRELNEMRESVFKPTNSRSVLGSVNDFAKAVKWRLYEEPDADLVALALWLNETPILPLGGRSPDELTRERLQ